jgi:hypothetical protein
MWCPGKRHRYEKNKRAIGDTAIGNPTPAHHCIIDGADHRCGPDAALAPRGTGKADVSATAMATMAATGTDETDERSPTVATVATTREIASDVSKVVFLPVVTLGPHSVLGTES